MNTPTPETDEHQDDLVHADTYTCWQQTLNLARKLERERDEAQRVISEQHAQIIGLYAIEDELRNERDRLRKVCDELYESIGCVHCGPDEFCAECKHKMRSYHQLPHVKK